MDECLFLADFYVISWYSVNIYWMNIPEDIVYDFKLTLYKPMLLLFIPCMTERSWISCFGTGNFSKKIFIKKKEREISSWY